jgi:hypothetical protein
MNISGKIIQILPEVKGEGKNGPWSRQDFIIETDGQFSKKVCVSVWNNKIKLADLKTGDEVNLEISIESREYNGRWYTDVRAAALLSTAKQGIAEADEPGNPWDKAAPLQEIKEIEEEESEPDKDDLPF